MQVWTKTPSIGIKSVSKPNKQKANQYLLHVLPSAQPRDLFDQRTHLPPLPRRHRMHLQRSSITRHLRRTQISSPANLTSTVGPTRPLLPPKSPCPNVEPVRKRFAADLSHPRMGNCQGAIINVVSVARHVKNRSRRRVSTSCRTGRIVNNITMNSITRRARTVARVSKDIVYNLKIQLFVIPLVLLARYAPSRLD